jgi:hypothetical protein
MCTSNSYDKIITLIQSKPIIKKNSSFLLFSGDLFCDNVKCGIVRGKTEKMIDEINSNNIITNNNIRTRSVYYDLIYGEIITQGLNVQYGNDGLLKNESIIPIIGGTKEYEGITGVVKTNLLNNGEYKHIFYINY